MQEGQKAGEREVTETQEIPIGTSSHSAPATWDLQPPFKQGQWKMMPAEIAAGMEPILETLHTQGRRIMREKGAFCPHLLICVRPHLNWQDLAKENLWGRLPQYGGFRVVEYTTEQKQIMKQKKKN